MSGTVALKWPRRGIGQLPASLCRAAAAVGLAMLMAAAAAVLWRQLAGALRHPLAPSALLAAAVTATVAAAAIRGELLRQSGDGAAGGNRPAWLHWTITIAVSLAVVELTVGLCLPGTPAACLAVVAALTAVEESWAWVGHLRRSARGAGCQPAAVPGQVDNLAHKACPTLRSAAAPGPVDNLPHDALPPEGVVQQLTRSRAADGSEEIAGWLRAAFASGQRTTSVHVAFCPPLASAPELSVEQIDGPEARVKAAQVLAYGARLDLKLATAYDEPAEVLLQFSARTAGEK
jgi:hypothetical protein